MTRASVTAAVEHYDNGRFLRVALKRDDTERDVCLRLGDGDPDFAAMKAACTVLHDNAAGIDLFSIQLAAEEALLAGDIALR